MSEHLGQRRPISPDPEPVAATVAPPPGEAVSPAGGSGRDDTIWTGEHGIEPPRDRYGSSAHAIARADGDERVKVMERPRKDRVRWGPIWAGLVTALATFLLLQLALFATDLISLDINPSSSENAIPFWTGLAAIVAFLLGGVVAGATTQWDRRDDGLLHGILMWALAIVALVVLSIFGAGALTSGLGDVLGDFDAISTAVSDVNTGDVNADNAIDEAREAAAAAALFLGITFVAAALGGLIGAGMWPRRGRARRDDVERDDLALR